MNQDQTSFTGRTRERKTKRSVHIMDVVARTVIATGGLMTIVAVFTVCFFLVWVVLPLFRSAEVEPPTRTAAHMEGVKPLAAGADEYRRLGWAIYPDSTLDVFRLDTGKSLSRKQLFDSPKMTCVTYSTEHSDLAFGFEDGTVRIGRLGFPATFVEPKDAPDALKHLALGQVVEHEGSVAELIPSGQIRIVGLNLTLEDPIQAIDNAAVVKIDASRGSTTMVFAVLGSDGQLLLESVRARRNIMTNKVTYQKQVASLPFDLAARGMPRFLRLSGLGDNVFAVWEDGSLIRYDTREYDKPRIAEEIDLTPEPGVKVTSLEFLLGKSTLISGDTLGRVRAWFRVKPTIVAQTTDGRDLVLARNLDPELAARLVTPSAASLPPSLDTPDRFRLLTTSDGSLLVKAHDLPGSNAAVTSLASSARTRLLAAAFEDGTARLYQVTSHKLLAEITSEDRKAMNFIAITPKDDGLVGITPAAVYSWTVDIGYPETTIGSLFGKVWYEGYEKPEHVWQSVGGTDDFEPKFGLVPLIFGTIKATFYSLLFGVPLALLAAIYTSEFLSPRARGRIKPAIETMASLPSVVLGFLAAIVIAPAMEDVVPATLCCLLCIPMAYLVGAYLWQLLPYKFILRYEFLRFPFMLVVLPLGLWLAYFMGPLAEQTLFGGNIKLWLSWKPSLINPDVNSPYASPLGGWMILMLPVSAMLVGLGIAQLLNPMLRGIASGWDRRQAALMDVVKFVIAAAATLGVALILSAFMSHVIGWDARGSYIDTFVQRNALVVGLIMGFAIIPIIYTISDDALSAVPQHLRSASLGAGATRWQTTVRIIVPTAMSGLFSAIMIGVGRAVGETMIVLMAAGNTPVMEWNIFNGFRTLSANIAVELPEAVKNSTHFRTLFLAALTLFAMTFVLNTIAETIRMRFRKRAFQL